MKIICY